MTDSQRWFTFVIVLITLGLVYLLGPILMPFLISFLLAYLLNPVVTRLQAWKIPRVISATLVFLIVIMLLIAFFFLIVPTLENQISVFVKRLPTMMNWVQTTALPWINAKLDSDVHLDIGELRDQLLAHLQSNGTDWAKIAMRTIFSSGYLAVEVIMNIILIPVVTLYLLSDWHQVTESTKSYLPMTRSQKSTTVKLVRACGDVLAGFIRGQLMVMLSLGIVYCIGLSILGLDLALLIGMCAGILSIVPYLGFITGLLLAIATALIQFHSWFSVIGVLIVFAIGQICEGFVFSPLFVGDRIGLHPVAVIFAVLAGGKLFGFVGVLLALPVAAVIMVFLRHWIATYFDDNPDGAKDV